MLQRLLDLFQYLPEFIDYFNAGAIIFSRFAGFFMFAPVFNRKNIPKLLKGMFTVILTVSFLGILPIEPVPQGTSVFLLMVVNSAFGAVLGYIGYAIIEAVTAAGEIINMQMGLSSAVMFDPATKQQSSIMGRFFSQFAAVIFINFGGLHILLSAFQKSFEIFPMYSVMLPLDEILSLNYVILLTGNLLTIGLQISAPVLLTTLCQDTILGIISKTAPQVNVFQLSFMLKPAVGVIVLLFTYRLMFNVITDHFVQYFPFL